MILKRAWRVLGTLITGMMVLPQHSRCTVQAAEAVCHEDGTCEQQQPTCQMVMAESTLSGAGWGLFTTVDRAVDRTNPLLFGDLGVHVTDLHNATRGSAAHRLLEDYAWSAEQTGGIYEGEYSLAILPGVGTLANSVNKAAANARLVLPGIPAVDGAGLTRATSPGAGAITQYHNYTWYVKKPIEAGEEIFVDYGQEWFEKRNETRSNNTSLVRRIGRKSSKRPVDWLLQHGYCVDHVKAGRSEIKDAGRGLFAARNIPRGATVVPVPVVAIADQRALDMDWERPDGRTVNMKQLALNYCLGHKESSVLLYPIGPGMNLVNHARKKRANVRLQWVTIPYSVSRADLIDWQDPLSPEGPKLLLKLVATKNIREGQEILLDYGSDWTKAWARHNASWVPRPEDYDYVPSYSIKRPAHFRTTAEAIRNPYPDNIITSCFYQPSAHAEALRRTADDPDAIVPVSWTQTQGIFDYKNLRPCLILERDSKDSYTVQIENRWGLPEDELVTGVHVVTNVPKKAIRFNDKPYTTDQHLEWAFRHPIGLPDELWPEQWKD